VSRRATAPQAEFRMYRRQSVQNPSWSPPGTAGRAKNRVGDGLPVIHPQMKCVPRSVQGCDANRAAFELSNDTDYAEGSS
jgi:hypothetical protein